MTQYQRNRIKEGIDKQTAAADAEADKIVTKGETLLGKLKASKYTALGLLAGAATLVVFILK